MTVFNKSRSYTMIGYSIVTITAPVLGLLSGGKIIDYLVKKYLL